MDRRRFLHGLAGSGLAKGNFAGDEGVEQVLVMFKCHLDVGFVDTQAAIIRRYFTQFYPRAIAIAESTRSEGRAQFVWTTGSWMLYRYLEQANAQDRKRMENAIAHGDIAWHALPFTWQTELLDRSTIAGCLGFSKTLDRRFGRTTTGAKMTDVPGHSRGLIAPLMEGGVQFLDIGVNAASTPPDVPAMFVWKDARGASIIVMYHRTEYGGWCAFRDPSWRWRSKCGTTTAGRIRRKRFADPWKATRAISESGDPRYRFDDDRECREAV